MKRYLTFGAWLVVLTVGMCGLYAAGPDRTADPHVNAPFTQLSEEIVTPHIPWAKPYYRGELRVMVITHRYGHRETIELAQRLSIRYTPVFFYNQNNVGTDTVKDPYLRGIPGTSEAEVLADLRRKIEAPYEVIMIGPVSWSLFPRDIEYAILKKVHDGAGLVYTNARNPDQYLQKALQRKPKEGQDLSYAGMPIKALPAFIPKPAEPGKPAPPPPPPPFRTAQLGQGRIVILDYPATGWHAFTPATAGFDLFSDLDYEYYQSMLIKALLWAARWEPEITIQSITPSDGTVVSLANLNKTPIQLNLLNNFGRPVRATIEFITRTPHNQVECIRTNVTITPGASTHTFVIPHTRAGRLFADFIIRRGDKVLNWGSSYLDVQPPLSIESVASEKDCYNAGETVKGQVRLTEGNASSPQVSVFLMDNFERILARTDIKLSSGQRTVPFSFAIKRPLTVLHRVVAQLRSGESIWDTKYCCFTVPFYPRDEVMMLMWGGGRGGHVGRLFHQRTRAVGFDTYDIGMNWLEPEKNRETIDSLARLNMHPLPYMWRFSTEESPPDNIRKPCLTDPVYRQKMKDGLQGNARLVMKYGPPAYTLGDENFLGQPNSDICFSPTCVEDFRVWLKKVYGTLDALNTEWGTSYKDWSEVRPITLPEAKKLNRWPQWADHRMHMEWVFTDVHDYAIKAIKAVDPQARVGLDGPSFATSYNGYNWWELMKIMDMCGTYPHPAQCESVASFAKPGTLTGCWFGGYRSQRREETLRYFPWWHLFSGFNSLWYYIEDGIADGGCCECALAPDMRCMPYFQWVKEEMDEIRAGVGKLLIHAQRQYDPIAILYSQASVHASTLDNSAGRYEDSINNTILLLKDLGYQARVLSYEQLENGELLRGGYKALVLPLCQAMSAKECDAVREFVKNGGLLVADARPAVMDAHCKPLPTGGLDDVFGVKQQKAPLPQPSPNKTETVSSQPRVSGEHAGVRFDATIDGYVADTDLTVRQSAVALGNLAGTPFLTINTFGKGKAVLLNLVFKYQSMRNAGKDDDMRNLMSNVLRLGGISSRIALTTSRVPLKATEAVFFRDGDAQYVGILRDHRVKDLERKPMRVKLPSKSFLYDVRGGRYLGETDTASTTINPGGAVLYAMLPFKIKGISLSAATPVKRGDPLKVEVTLNATPAPSAPSVVHLDFIDPSGRIYEPYSVNLRFVGNTVHTVDLALNETVGEWRVRAIEVVSKKRAESKFRVID